MNSITYLKTKPKIIITTNKFIENLKLKKIYLVEEFAKFKKFQN